MKIIEKIQVKVNEANDVEELWLKVNSDLVTVGGNNLTTVVSNIEKNINQINENIITLNNEINSTISSQLSTISAEVEVLKTEKDKMSPAHFVYDSSLEALRLSFS